MMSMNHCQNVVQHTRYTYESEHNILIISLFYSCWKNPKQIRITFQTLWKCSLIRNRNPEHSYTQCVHSTVYCILVTETVHACSAKNGTWHSVEAFFPCHFPPLFPSSSKHWTPTTKTQPRGGKKENSNGTFLYCIYAQLFCAKYKQKAVPPSRQRFVLSDQLT